MAPEEEHRRGSSPKVVVHGKDVSVDEARTGIPLAEVKERFGGVDPLGVLAGLAAAIGTLAVLGSLLAAAGAGGYGAVDSETLGLVALVAGLVALALSLLFGGYVAGRTARYAGVRNGLLTGLLFLLVSAGLSALASSTDEASRLQLPGWLDRSEATTAAIISSLVALALVLGASALGGWLGARWHRGPDSVLAGTRAGALAPYADEGEPGTGTHVTSPSASAPRSAATSTTKKAKR